MPHLSLYAQDTWKATPKLTLTYGVRWELSPAPSARGNTTLAAWQNTSDPASIALAPSGTPLWRTTYGNFAPRFGFAYRFTSNGDLVLRAGSGIFYDLGVGAAANFGELFPNTARLPGVQVSVPVPDVTPYLTTNFSSEPPSVSVFGFSNSLSLPRSYQWNVALEKSIVGKQAISVTYVGQAGRDLLRNEALLRPNVNFTGNFFLTGNTARSNYNALQFQFRRPLSSRLQALLNYTWSHSLDNASSDVVLFLPSNVISAENDYAASNFDVRHSFSGAITYDVPGLARSGILALLTNHWSFQSFIVVRTGFPLNATVSGTSPVGGTVKTRPDRVAGAPSWISNPAAPGGKALNTAAFSKPTTPRQGTEGRNDITGFGLTQLDLSIGRKFPITERLNLEFRTDAFNLPNHPNFSNPFGCIDFPSFVPCVQSGGMLNQALGGLNPLFQEGGPRSLQLALKINF